MDIHTVAFLPYDPIPLPALLNIYHMIHYLCIKKMFGGVGLVAVDVHANRGARAARAAQAEDDARAVLENHANAL